MSKTAWKNMKYQFCILNWANHEKHSISHLNTVFQFKFAMHCLYSVPLQFSAKFPDLSFAFMCMQAGLSPGCLKTLTTYFLRTLLC